MPAHTDCFRLYRPIVTVRPSRIDVTAELHLYVWLSGSDVLIPSSAAVVCLPTRFPFGRCRGAYALALGCQNPFLRRRRVDRRGERFSASAFVYGLNPVAGETSRRKNIQSRFISPPSWWNCTLVCPPSTKSSILGK